MIEKLTAVQEAALPVYTKKWIDIGLSTQPGDHGIAERALRAIYEQAGLSAPEIVWCGSPMGAMLTQIKTAEAGRVTLVPDVIAALQDKALAAKAGKLIHACCFGQHDAHWLGFYEFFRKECGLVNETDPIKHHIVLASHTGWWIPFEGICFVSEKMAACSLDEEGRIHNESGPAIAYPDGWGVYGIHGVRLPSYIITNPEQITIQKILKQGNTEVRRVMIDRMGYDRFILESGAERKSVDEFGELYSIAIEDDEPVTVVKVLNSTPEPDGSVKTYFLRAPPNIKTAHEGVAWTFGKTSENYAPLVET